MCLRLDLSEVSHLLEVCQRLWWVSQLADLLSNLTSSFSADFSSLNNFDCFSFAVNVFQFVTLYVGYMLVIFIVFQTGCGFIFLYCDVIINQSDLVYIIILYL